MEYFSAENLTKEFDSAKISVTFSVKQNTFTSIVGPSGSGKSTVLRMIAGLEQCNNGKIFLDGNEITNVKPQDRQLGMVFQNASLFMNMNVEQNIAYGLKCKGFKKNEISVLVKEWLSKVQMEGFEKRNCSSLSGGESQRIALARTLIINPKLLLLDEPLSALDAPLRKSLAAQIRKLQLSLGITVLMVTHDIEEAKSVSDKIILLKKGQICWTGIPLDFKDDFLV